MTQDALLDPEQRQAQQFIAAIIERTGLTASEIARKAGLSPSTLTRIYPIPSVSYTLSARTLGKLTAAFPDTRLELAADAAPVAGGFKTPQTQMRANANAATPTIVHLALDAQSGEGALETYRIQPGGLVSNLDDADGIATRYFAAFMPGDAMEPRIRGGDALLVDRMRPPPLRADVFVVLATPEGSAARATIAELIERSRESLVLAQGGDAPVRFERGEIAAIHHIAGRFDPGILDHFRLP